MIVAIGGLPGVGKTTTARELARRLRAAHVRIDSLESALVTGGLVATPADVGPAGYELALAVADTCLAAGGAVVVDAVFPIAVSRRPWTELAGRHGVPISWVRLVCSDVAEHRRRVESREFDLPGSGRPDWAAVAARETDEWAEPHAVVDTAAGDPAGAIEELLAGPAGVVRRHVAAFDAGDLEGLLAGFTHDARWRTGRSDATGSDELRELFTGAIGGLAPRLTVRRLVEGPDGVVAAELTETWTRGGTTRTAPLAGWYRVRDGRVAEARIYREGSAEP